MGTPNSTQYRCPICDAVLVEVSDPEPWSSPVDLPPLRAVGLDENPARLGGGVSLEDYLAATVQRVITEHRAEVERQLRAAAETHECEHPLRWRLWRWRHRDAFAAA